MVTYYIIEMHAV